MIKKVLVLIIIFILLSFSLYGCYDSNSLENFAYVVGLGIDKGSDNAIKVTFQFAKPSSSSDSSTTQSDESSITSVECSSIDAGIALVNSYISKQINLTHCQVIVFSEIIAEEGIQNYIDTLMNNIEIRPDCNILITRCDASNFIENTKPSLTNLTAEYYEVLLNSQEYTGYTAETPIWKVSAASPNKIVQSVAVLGGLNMKSSATKTNNNLSLIQKETEYKADTTTISDSNKAQIMGLAVFDENKLVGELTSMESICYLLLRNNLKSCTISIPSPFNQEESIDLVLKINNNSKSDVKLVNNTPFITCNIELRGAIQSYSGKSDYSIPENIDIVETYAESYMKNQINNFLYKTAKEFNSDIIGFGYKTSRQYTTTNDWIESNWHSNYKNSFFKVNVEATIKTSSLFLKH